MSQITSHVLDTSRGKPASQLLIILSQQSGDSWTELARGSTSSDGRVSDFLPQGESLPAGCYRLHFDTQTYFDKHQQQGFYPYVDIVFKLDASGDHYHIPLLLSAYSYSTYRGS